MMLIMVMVVTHNLKNRTQEDFFHQKGATESFSRTTRKIIPEFQKYLLENQRFTRLARTLLHLWSFNPGTIHGRQKMNRLRKTNNQKFRRKKRPQEPSFASKATYFGGLGH
jgi:hypothetical protein